MTNKLRDKVAVVTGASKGIGASIAKHLAAEGAAVAVNYSSGKEGAERIVKEICDDGGRAIAVQANVSKSADVKRLFDETKKAFGKLDILVNNAGIYEFASLEEVSEELFHNIFNVNVLGLLLVSQEALKYFGPSGGVIVNTSSVASKLAFANSSVYSASKAAVDAITKTLSTELGPRNIRVNAINPGVVETEGTLNQGITESDFSKQIVSQTSLGRIGRPVDIAPAVVFLASDDADFITGETLVIAGGLH